VGWVTRVERQKELMMGEQGGTRGGDPGRRSGKTRSFDTGDSEAGGGAEKKKPIAPPPESQSRRSMLGKYVLVAKISAGGGGVIYEGFDEAMNRKVALKVLAPDKAKDSVGRERFINEAKALARINSQNVVTVITTGEAKGLYYFAMDYIEGKNLKQFVDQGGAIPVDRALGYTRQAVLGLKAAFEGDVIHRDIKPSNLMLDNADQVVITDFGLAKGAFRNRDLTRKGRVLGTPSYMSPEQVKSGPTDFRSDIYGLGATLFFLLTSRPPYVASSVFELLQMHVTDPVPEVAGAPDSINKLIGRMLAKTVEERHGSYDELIAEIDHLTA
jgi:serine/threonine protein kinase